jgi:parvulin-like peptidyl-prolyl isomerase
MSLRGPLGTWLLAMGATAGVGLAGWTLLEPTPGHGPLPPGVVAVVDGRPILAADYERALRAVAADGADPSHHGQRVLDRLIDETLLVEHGLELGLAHRDARVRADLSAAVLALVTARAEDEAAEATEAELRAFFDRHRGWFRAQPRIHVAQLFFRVRGGDDAAARARAEAAVAQWRAGASHGALSERSDPFDVPLPNVPLPPSKLRDYLGPTVMRGVADAPEDTVVGPLRSGNGYHAVRVLRREPGAALPFEQVRDQVRAEHRRRLAETRLRALLEAKRASAQIQVDPEIL